MYGRKEWGHHVGFLSGTESQGQGRGQDLYVVDMTKDQEFILYFYKYTFWLDSLYFLDNTAVCQDTVMSGNGSLFIYAEHDTFFDPHTHVPNFCYAPESSRRKSMIRYDAILCILMCNQKLTGCHQTLIAFYMIGV